LKAVVKANVLKILKIHKTFDTTVITFPSIAISNFFGENCSVESFTWGHSRIDIPLTESLDMGMLRINTMMENMQFITSHTGRENEWSQMVQLRNRAFNEFGRQYVRNFEMGFSKGSYDTVFIFN
jgi:hypothetical protein